jgi:hypothetical protein
MLTSVPDKNGTVQTFQIAKQRFNLRTGLLRQRDTAAQKKRDNTDELHLFG